MSKVTVILSQQDLGDFLDGNQDYMNQYAAELERRLGKKFDEAEVSISRNALRDEVDVDGDNDEEGIVAHTMDQMGNDWSWLQQ